MRDVALGSLLAEGRACLLFQISLKAPLANDPHYLQAFYPDYIGLCLPFLVFIEILYAQRKLTYFAHFQK